jgi:hypothetical protein
MVLGTEQLPRYLVDDITKPTLCMLQVPFGRVRKRKEVAQGAAMPCTMESPSHLISAWWTWRGRTQNISKRSSTFQLEKATQ